MILISLFIKNHFAFIGRSSASCRKSLLVFVCANIKQIQRRLHLILSSVLWGNINVGKHVINLQSLGIYKTKENGHHKFDILKTITCT